MKTAIGDVSAAATPTCAKLSASDSRTARRRRPARRQAQLHRRLPIRRTLAVAARATSELRIRQVLPEATGRRRRRRQHPLLRPTRVLEIHRLVLRPAPDTAAATVRPAAARSEEVNGTTQYLVRTRRISQINEALSLLTSNLINLIKTVVLF